MSLRKRFKRLSSVRILLYKVFVLSEIDAVIPPQMVSIFQTVAQNNNKICAHFSCFLFHFDVINQDLQKMEAELNADVLTVIEIFFFQTEF